MKKMEYEIGIDEKLMKKYNAIVNFLEKNKNKEVVFENGCLNYVIEDVIYTRSKIERRIFDTVDSIEFIFKDNKHCTIENASEVKIDRKFKTIYLSKYFSL